MTEILYIGNTEQAHALAAQPEIINEHTLVIAPSLGASCILEQNCIPYQSYAEYFSSISNHEVRQSARYLARYYFEGESLKSSKSFSYLKNYKGYPVFHMLHAHLRPWFAEMIMSLEGCQKIINEHKDCSFSAFLEKAYPYEYWHFPQHNLESEALRILCKDQQLPFVSRDLEVKRTTTKTKFIKADTLRSVKSKTKKRILFITHAGHYSEQILPKIKELAQNKSYDLHLVSHELLPTATSAYLDHLGVDLWQVDDFLTESPDLSEVISEAKQELLSNNELKQYFESKSIKGIWELASQRLAELFTNDLPECLSLIDCAERMIDHLEPDLLYSSLDQVSKDLPFVLAARQRAIATLSNQHGIWPNSAIDQQAFASEEICLWGEHSSKLARENFSTPAESLNVIGNPFFEERYLTKYTETEAKISHQSYKVSFVGTYSEKRLKLIHSLNEAGLKVDVFGDKEWERSPHPLLHYHGLAEANDCLEIYRSSVINLNISNEHQSSVPPERLFEIASINGFFLSDKQDNVVKIFNNSPDVFYENEQELIQKIKLYLDDPTIRQNLSQEIKEQAEQSATALNLDKTKPVCTFLGAMGWVWGPDFRHSEKQVFNALIKLCEEIPDLQLILRLHKGDNVEAIAENFSKFAERVKFDPPVSLEKTLKASDLVITQQTTAGLEAILTNKPVIYLNIASETDTVPYANSGASTAVYSQNELIEEVKKVIAHPPTPEELKSRSTKLVESYLNGLKGDAAKNFASLCQKILNSPIKKAGFEDWLKRSEAFTNQQSDRLVQVK